MVDLNTLLASGSDLTLTEALFINDAGEIAGNGVLQNGDADAFVLIPCDENHPGVDGCDYSLVDASATAADRPTPTQKPTTADQWVSGTAKPMMRIYRNLEVQPPLK